MLADIFFKLVPTTRKFFGLISFLSFVTMLISLVYAGSPWYLFLSASFLAVAMYWAGMAEKDPELETESFLHEISKGDLP